jgi:hypothetical protein
MTITRFRISSPTCRGLIWSAEALSIERKYVQRGFSDIPHRLGEGGKMRAEVFFSR